MKSILFRKQKQYSLLFAKMQLISRLVLTTPNRSPYPVPAFTKSEAECGNSNSQTANSSTPLTRAFFVRSSRIPKERPLVACSSMVACSGQGLALDCDPFDAVFHPVTRYRLTLWKMSAIALFNFQTELLAMLFKFLLLGKKRLTIRVRAHTEQEARQRLNLSHNALCIARFNTEGGIYA